MEYGPGKTGGIEHSNEHSKHMIQINKKVRLHGFSHTRIDT